MTSTCARSLKWDLITFRNKERIEIIVQIGYKTEDFGYEIDYEAQYKIVPTGGTMVAENTVTVMVKVKR